ncbi:Gamma-tubulin complex component [Thalictrum thalictroides]|uniref:Gamma-tubulin complex component n=1 Tax=Thalictrum thalictroides TaxID=46969 RepID=A0A7J6VQJ8_THATH|nr:Gamma-tubulin complex component [Thalictrum thalictroides]
MAVDLSFSSLFQNLKLDDPWLPSKPWESIPSESGEVSNQSENPSQQKPLYDPSTISEVNLVRLVINALQGVEASLHSIEKLSESFCNDSTDKTSLRIPSLWYRSSSTNALGKILKPVGHSGLITFLVRKFVDYFHRQNLYVRGISKEDSECDEACSLVNQAFAAALEKVLEGLICALDTLYASAQLRRSPDNFDTYANNSFGVGCLTSVVHSEITFMEVYLHTNELRTQIQVIGNICLLKNVALAFSTLSIEDLTSEATTDFRNFPKGADLLSYLYSRLRDADPVHHALLKFLFTRSCEPYYGFIKSWIYEARINDPYKEFIVELVDGPPSYSDSRASFSNAVWLSSIRVREGVSVPCFLENYCLPLLRAGQQLQVLIKLLQLCECVPAGDQAYVDVLPYWNGSSGFCLSTMSPLTFSKVKLEEMVLSRENMYKTMQEKLQILIARLDNKYRPISSSVMPCLIVPLVGNNSTCSIDERMINPTTYKGNLDWEASTHKSGTSGAIDGISYQLDPFESSSECSWTSSGEHTETEETTNSDTSLIEAELRYLSALGFSENLPGRVTVPTPCLNEKLERNYHKKTERMDPISKYGDSHKEKKSSHISEHHKSANTAWSHFSEIVYTDIQSVKCWPLGGLSKNPFYDDGGSKGESQLHLSDFSLDVPDSTQDVVVEEVPYWGELATSIDSLPKSSRGDVQLETGSHASSNSHISTSWKLRYNCNIFNMNPMLTKNAWSGMIEKSRGKSCVDKQSFLSYFDFSSVNDFRMVYGERSNACPDYGIQSKHYLFSDSAVSSTKPTDKGFGLQKYGESHIPADNINFLSDTLFEKRQKENTLTSTTGGAKWESSLSYLGKRFIHNSGAQKNSSGPTFDVPLDVIIEKCMLQEILLQYEYISNFTITFLEEGFDLQEHLLALRRYHFMEFADWADLFIVSLWCHNWSVVEASEKITEIQGLLDLAVQRSSCEGDPYKERLYLYMKGHDMMPLSTPTTGVHAFDFFALGYRVDWPVSIVLTPSALKIYADIFSFLIQVKLAVFSLTDVWCSMKDLDHLISQNYHSGLDEQDKIYIKILTRMRHQVNHFVSTLQQYVQSQLSHVSWCRFLDSLKHQVKDMFDLESVHMAYLADSLHICFLSADTQPIAGIIESILQCALDFRSCFTGGCWEVGSECRDSSKILGRLNISQVLTIKATFEKNLKELYLCYLKSPKHGEFSLCRFWGYLNYNEYYSSIFGNGLIHYAF